jgi:hypothetical protein
MSDYIHHLASRSLQTIEMVVPRPTGLFEPVHQQEVEPGRMEHPGQDGLPGLPRLDLRSEIDPTLKSSAWERPTTVSKPSLSFVQPSTSVRQKPAQHEMEPEQVNVRVVLPDPHAIPQELMDPSVHSPLVIPPLLSQLSKSPVSHESGENHGNIEGVEISQSIKGKFPDNTQLPEHLTLHTPPPAPALPTLPHKEAVDESVSEFPAGVVLANTLVQAIQVPDNLPVALSKTRWSEKALDDDRRPSVPPRPTTPLEKPHLNSTQAGEPSAPTEPIIQIRIGRIEVRAALQPAPHRNDRSKSPPTKTIMTLDEYLSQRANGDQR